MERAVKLKELLMAVIGICITFGTMLYNRGTAEGKNIEHMAVQDLKITQLSEELKEQRQMIYEMMQQQGKNNEDMRNSINDIKVLLQNKQDRR